jgi:hypothetical protein
MAYPGAAVSAIGGGEGEADGGINVDIGVSGIVGSGAVLVGSETSAAAVGFSCGTGMAGVIASSLRAFSPLCLAHLRAAATRRAQCTEQKRPDPYVSSCVSPQLSHEAPGRDARFERGVGDRMTAEAEQLADFSCIGELIGIGAAALVGSTVATGMASDEAIPSGADDKG